MTIFATSDVPTFKWGIVTGVNPLQIKLDGDSAPLALIPDAIGGSFSIGDRIRAELSKNRVVVHGKAGAQPTGELTSQNLNDITATGSYVQGLSANATVARNYPVVRAGILEVVSSLTGSDFVMQRYTDYQFSTDGSTTRFIYIRNYWGGTWYPWRRATDMSRGPSSAKPSSPQYWEFYYETDTRNMLVGNKSGGWRRYSGAAQDSAKAWTTTSGSTLAGQTVVFTLPTVLESSESLMVTMDPAVPTSGFDFIGVTALERNPTNTIVSVRLMQLLSVATQPLAILWQITPATN